MGVLVVCLAQFVVLGLCGVVTLWRKCVPLPFAPCLHQPPATRHARTPAYTLRFYLHLCVAPLLFAICLLDACAMFPLPCSPPRSTRLCVFVARLLRTSGWLVSTLGKLPLMHRGGFLEPGTPLRSMLDGGPWGLVRWCRQDLPVPAPNEPAPTCMPVPDEDVALGLISSRASCDLGEGSGNLALPVYVRVR